MLGKRNRAKKKREREREKGKAQGKMAKEVIARIFCWAPGFPKRSKKQKTKIDREARPRCENFAYTVNSFFLENLHKKFMLEGPGQPAGNRGPLFWGQKSYFSKICDVNGKMAPGSNY